MTFSKFRVFGVLSAIDVIKEDEKIDAIFGFLQTVPEKKNCSRTASTAGAPAYTTRPALPGQTPDVTPRYLGAALHSPEATSRVLGAAPPALQARPAPMTQAERCCKMSAHLQEIGSDTAYSFILFRLRLCVL